MASTTIFVIKYFWKLPYVSLNTHSVVTKKGPNIYVKSTKPRDKGFLFTHHFFLLAITLNTLMNKLTKLATGKNLKNVFSP